MKKPALLTLLLLFFTNIIPAKHRSSGIPTEKNVTVIVLI